jgi:uncharacterized protein YdaU (DUF1376 family)
MALPYINLYIGDLKKDTDLLSPAAFGAYMRLMLFHMHESKVRGQVTFSLPQLCRIFGAQDLQQTQELLIEIVNPDFSIVDYDNNGGAHLFKNRRMIRETALSVARSAAGKKGAETTNKKFRQNSKDAEGFATANGAADAVDFAEEVDTTNDEAKKQQNYNTNNNINSNTEEGKEGVGEKETPIVDFYSGPGKVLIVPELKSAWLKLRPDYVFDNSEEPKELREIANKIAQADKIKNLGSIEGTDMKTVDRVKYIFETLVSFSNTHNLYSTFTISQFRKYFNSIAQACKASRTKEQATAKNSPIEKNMANAQGAQDLINRKYGNQQ